MKLITTKFIYIVLGALLLSSCASAPDRASNITGKQNWSIIVEQFTGSFVFETREDGISQRVRRLRGHVE